MPLEALARGDQDPCRVSDKAAGRDPSAVDIPVAGGLSGSTTQPEKRLTRSRSATWNSDGKPDLVAANYEANPSTVSVLLNRPGFCTVQNVKGKTLPTARLAIARANCRVGKIRRAYSRATRGRVTSQQPAFGAVLPGGGKVDLVVSRGKRSS